MAANFWDRFQVLIAASGFKTSADFIDSLQLENDRFTSQGSAKEAYERWKDDPTKFPRKAPVDALRAFFKKKMAGKEDKVDLALDPNNSMTIAQLLQEVDVRFSELIQVSPPGKIEWQNRYFGMHFMKVLSDKYEEEENGNNGIETDGVKVLKCMLGTYVMYRKHSVLPGIIKEFVVITKRNHSDCEGFYFQYSSNKEVNIAKFNALYCGFYVQAFGTLRRENRLEIIDTRILIGNSRVEVDGISSYGWKKRYFTGILTGIYDHEEALMAERVLIRKMNNRPSEQIRTDADGNIKCPEKLKQFMPRRLLPDARSDAEYMEYVKVRDAVSNEGSGQVLSTRLEQTTLVGAR